MSRNTSNANIMIMQPWSTYITSRLTTLFVNHDLVQLHMDLHHIKLGSFKHSTTTASLAPGSSDIQSPFFRSLLFLSDGNWTTQSHCPSTIKSHRPSTISSSQVAQTICLFMIFHSLSLTLSS